MTKRKPAKPKRYRWTPATAPSQFDAMNRERQRDFERAFVKIRRGEISLRTAAKEFKIDRENLTAYVRAFGAVESKPGRPLRILEDRRPVSVNVVTDDGEIAIEATGEEAHIARQHREALNAARKFRDRSKLLPWRRKFVRDREGKRYDLLSSLDKFFELFPPDEFNPASIYA
jgi:hypothetical protein